MTKRYLLAAVGVAALTVAGPALALSPGYGGDPSLDLNVSLTSSVDSSLRSEIEYEKDVSLRGNVELSGHIRVDSSAVALNDPAQMLDNNWVSASDDNRVYVFDIGGTGNIGVNLAAGALNQQTNSGVIAVSDYAGTDAGNRGGWAEATTVGAQSLFDTNYGAQRYNNGNDGFYDYDGGDSDNRVDGGRVAGSGNIGLNAAAGAFNQQANLMTMAVATNSSLAEANAGLLQTASNSGVRGNGDNDVHSLIIDAGSTGNIGVNMAAGVGNQQTNSLTIATTAQ